MLAAFHRGAGVAGHLRRAVVVALAWAAVMLVGTADLAAAPDYPGMVARIGAMLGEAATLYRAGQVDDAKGKVDQSYFEVFENLEGPIRVNISARKSNELEAEFSAIRKMIKDGEPLDKVEARIRVQMAELQAVLPTLAGGFVLKAERGDAHAHHAAAKTPAAPQPVDPRWAASVDLIQKLIVDAAAAYEAGDAAGARNLIIKAQFDGYKNSQLEIAIRQHVSRQRDAEFAAEFERILALVKDGEPARMVQASAEPFADDIRSDLPGLPFIESAKAQQKSAVAEPPKDWRRIAEDIRKEIAEAVRQAANGETGKAVGHVQDAYFDLFEASGMESRIGARDAAFKTQIEGHFSRIVGQIKGGATASDLDTSIAAMTADFSRAVAMLSDSGDSPFALFVYALGIIVREGFEAMLIVTAILAYLAKTGHADKQKVIYNSVGVALAASVVTAIVVKWVFVQAAASQEVLEGLTFLIAAVILFSMSYWLISKAEAEKWKAYVADKVGASLTTGSLWTLWFTSFLAVYREGAETVLFYQALTVDADTLGIAATAGGFVVGCLMLGVIYVLMRAGARKLPIRAFFVATSALLYVLAFVFAGRGVMELIEGRIVHPTIVSWAPEIPLLGIFPYWQTLLPQALIVAAALFAGAVLALRRAGPPDLARQGRSG
jgi:high-affinity iron transporter